MQQTNLMYHHQNQGQAGSLRLRSSFISFRLRAARESGKINRCQRPRATTKGKNQERKTSRRQVAPRLGEEFDVADHRNGARNRGGYRGQPTINTRADGDEIVVGELLFAQLAERALRAERFDFMSRLAELPPAARRAAGNHGPTGPTRWQPATPRAERSR